MGQDWGPSTPLWTILPQCRDGDRAKSRLHIAKAFRLDRRVGQVLANVPKEILSLSLPPSRDVFDVALYCSGTPWRQFHFSSLGADFPPYPLTSISHSQTNESYLMRSNRHPEAYRPGGSLTKRHDWSEGPNRQWDSASCKHSLQKTKHVAPRVC